MSHLRACLVLFGLRLLLRYLSKKLAAEASAWSPLWGTVLLQIIFNFTCYCMQARLLFNVWRQVCDCSCSSSSNSAQSGAKGGGQRCRRGGGAGQQLSLHPCRLLYCQQDGTSGKYSSHLSLDISCLRLTLIKIKMRLQELTSPYVKQKVRG